MTYARHLLIGAIVLVGLVGAGLAASAWLGRTRQSYSSVDSPLPRPDRIESEAALPKTTSQYVGTRACAECHAAEYGSYLRTAHSRSLNTVDPEAEPPDAVFRHELSGRTYEVRREQSQLIHREVLPAIGDAPEISSSFPVKYLVGSGHHTRSYLIEDNGFLAESPITWYESRKDWWVSPGYDRPHNLGFERAADMGCLICHLGRAEMVKQSSSRLNILEEAIGCERCHGPGAAHVAWHQQNRGTAGEEASGKDSPIVHPGRLSRGLAESICADCHLRGDATVSVPGREITDFRPGLPLHDFRIDYHLRSGPSGMKVVGHVEQMRLSRCYQESATLTCTTCHDPHGSPDESERVAYYRQRCHECHTQSCRLDEPERLKRTAEDNCIVCHMPQTETDIPHIAFTHHRIGFHLQPEAAEEKPVAGELVAVDIPSDLSDRDRDRCLGLAYLELATNSPPDVAVIHHRRASNLLHKAFAAGAEDGELLAALARLHWEQDSPQASSLALRALSDPRVSARAAVNAQFVLADIRYRQGDLRGAHTALMQLVQLRRHSEDWLLLGLTQARHGDLPAAVRSVERAAEISPYREEIRRVLADLYRSLNDLESARSEEEIANRLAPKSRG